MENIQDVGFNSDEVQKIAEQAVEQVVGKETAVYQKDKANVWTQQITDLIVIELAKLQKPYKYAVTCIIAENKGNVLHTASTAYWEIKKDGLLSVQVGSETFYCIVTVFSSSI
ncbi:UNKNOWN [Stylonychia lemnae]|uniref:Dynein light chain tctex-type 1 n=1 Tax=Stylonychia lemnae TaxID=5949 RepID=A0A078AIV4_STYLE|nr:UNKNOWN [Stylonychia lemnae]|eukprot:CDW82240.1 UNKNOWN [Stylonychia lemnae]